MTVQDLVVVLQTFPPDIPVVLQDSYGTFVSPCPQDFSLVPRENLGALPLPGNTDILVMSPGGDFELS